MESKTLWLRILISNLRLRESYSDKKRKLILLKLILAYKELFENVRFLINRKIEFFFLFSFASGLKIMYHYRCMQGDSRISLEIRMLTEATDEFNFALAFARGLASRSSRYMWGGVVFIYWLITRAAPTSATSVVEELQKIIVWILMRDIAKQFKLSQAQQAHLRQHSFYVGLPTANRRTTLILT